MAAVLNSSTSSVTLEVGEYQDFAKHQAEDAPVEAAHKPSRSTETCETGILNICLRLTMRMPTAEDGSCETETKPCPQDWLAFASSCYYVSTQRRSWNESRQYCLQNDADLVVISSIEEQKVLSGFIKAAWVGMTDREEEGKWTWVDGTPVNTERRELWARGQPDGAFGGEDCGELRAMCQFNGLNDYNCSSRIQWICEKLL
ncbi:CD209 antigen-like protein C isoform X13 [Takifugu flavidus]|uniref:CD209 antigen-like protein C isoform X13 n=1 Tax=Takifugu flavidus TaxID=433684 RepID=UPI002544868E|nr:CD209 antigen-like protein C isoform X13 [Takifugu flavidus]